MAKLWENAPLGGKLQGVVPKDPTIDGSGKISQTGLAKLASQGFDNATNSRVRANSLPDIREQIFVRNICVWSPSQVRKKSERKSVAQEACLASKSD